MIDFRYHLVSIVSIFLALAVGILLGAGPLQEDLGKTLTNQVSTLRKEKDALRTQLDQAQAELDASDKFAAGVTPALVGSRLGGRSVVVVVLPGADKQVVTGVTKVLTASGAKVNGTVTVQEAWTSVAKRTFRDQLLTSLGPLVGASGTDSGSLEARMGSLLAKALVVSRVSEADQPNPSATQALTGLREGDLLAFDGDGPVPATLAVVVAPQPAPKTSEDQRSADLAGWRSIATQLDAASSGAVVVGEPDSAGSGGLVKAVRDDDAAKKTVSTVDDVALTMGRITLVYALRQQMSGQAGQFGTAASASAVLPPVTASGS